MGLLTSVVVGLCAVLALGEDIPRPEHPRPDFERKAWVNLNGRWDFAFDPKNEGLKEGWFGPKGKFDRKIVVPFPWESKLSGVADTSRQKVGWYRREINPPAEWKGQRVWLCFGAIDWEAQVWVNGKEVGKHEGGYSPFALDITDRVGPGEAASLVVRTYDRTDPAHPTGKQVFWYTTTSGIWQTVWLEARPAAHLADLRLTPRREGGDWKLDVQATLSGDAGPAKLSVESADSSVSGKTVSVETKEGVARTTLAIKDPKPWTPESPTLYPLTIRVSREGQPDDRVETYFGLRTIGRGKAPGGEHESILLNGEPVYLRGALDQSFNPEGIYTAPSDAFLRRDIELAKKVGLNFLRIHIKAEEPRRLYWADKLGVMIMEDIPNTWTQSPAARTAWEATMRATIDRDRNHPSIVAWCLFNETWGLGNGPGYGDEFKRSVDTQKWVERMWKLVKEDLDPSRLVEDHSPDKRDHVVSDINSWHFYIDDYDAARRHIVEVVSKTRPGSPFNYVPSRVQGTEPLINSEYGAVSAGGGDRDVSWGFRYLTTQLRRHDRIQGYIYTELTDIEWEHNGFFDYDRGAKSFGYDAFVPGMTPADLQGADFIGFDAPPAMDVPIGVEFSIPLFVSHFSKREKPPRLRWWIVGTDDLGQEVKTAPTSIPVSWKPWGVTTQTPLRVAVPGDRPFVGAVALELIDDTGKRIAANFVNVVAKPIRVTESRAASKEPERAVYRAVEVLGPRTVAVRFAPEDTADRRWTSAPPQARQYANKVWGFGAGKFTYRVQLPEFVVKAQPAKVELLAEVAAKANAEQIDWPARRNRQDYPQTDERKHPSEVRVRLAGTEVGRWSLADDPADARGVLSHQAAFHHGAYGYLFREKLDLRKLPAIEKAFAAEEPIAIEFEVPSGTKAGGLAIFGRASGRYPLDPTLLITTEKDIGKPVGWIVDEPITVRGSSK